MITLSRWVADYYILATLLLAIAMAAGWCIAQPARRVALTRATLIGLALLAMLCALPGWSVVHVITREASLQPTTINAPPIDEESVAAEVAPIEAPVEMTSMPEMPSAISPPVAAPIPGTMRWSELIVWTYLAGSLLVIAWQLLGNCRARALVRRARPAPLELQCMASELRVAGVEPAGEPPARRRWGLRFAATPATPFDSSPPTVGEGSGEGAAATPRLLISPTLPTAVALGIFRPTILLPKQLVDAADPTALRTILAHELAHIRHGDLRLLALCRGLFVLLWVNPLFWLLRRWLRLDQETLADAAAAQVTTRHRYAEQLVDWAKRFATDRPPALAAAVGLWESPSQLRRRIAVLLDERLTIWRECSRRWRLASLAVCAVVAVGLSLVTLEPSSVEADGLDGKTVADKTKVNTPPTGKPSESQVLQGQVRDAFGQPVAGAQLWLVLRLGVDQVDGWLVRGASDKDGAFSLDVPGKWLAPGDFWPDYTLWCYSPNHEVASKYAYRQLYQGKNESLEITMLPQTDTSIIVYSPEGEPLENATIEPWHYLAGSYNVPPSELRQAISRTTDRKGRAILSTLGRGKLKSINVATTEYGIQRKELENSVDAPAERIVMLRYAGQLKGGLTAPDSQSVANRRVTVEGRDQRLPAEQTRGVAEAITDENGKFEIKAIAAGPYDLYIERIESDKYLPHIPEPIQVGADQTTSVDIPYERSVFAKGVIQTNQEHKPVRDALVSVRTFYGTRITGEVVRSDLNGQFSARVLPGTVRQSVIMRPREYEDWIQVEDEQTEKVAVPSSAIAVDLPAIYLVRTLEVKGQVLDANGLPIPAVRLSAITGNRVYSGAYTDAEGRFALRRPDGIEIEKYEVHVDRNRPGRYATIEQKEPVVLRLKGYHTEQTNGIGEDSGPEKTAEGNTSKSPSGLAPTNSSDEKPASAERQADATAIRGDHIKIGDHFILCPVTTDLQRSLLGGITNPAAEASLCVFVNGMAFSDDQIDAVSPEFVELADRLEEFATQDNRQVFFKIQSAVSPDVAFDTIRDRAMSLSELCELLGRGAGHKSLRSTQTYRGSDFRWEDFVAKARAASEAANSAVEDSIGNDRINVFPVRTLLSRLLVDADAVVFVTPVLRQTEGNRFPEDFVAELQHLVPQLTYEKKQTLLFDVRHTESAKERLEAWVEDRVARQEFAEQLGFENCQVAQSLTAEPEEAAKAAVP